MSRTPPWMVGVKERERERAREQRAVTIYGVFQHSSGPQGGYVVREGRNDNGHHWFPSPYSSQQPKAVSKSQKLAQRKADQLNGFV